MERIIPLLLLIIIGLVLYIRDAHNELMAYINTGNKIRNKNGDIIISREDTDVK